MDNRKIILAFYLAGSAVLWLLSRSAIQYFYITFYQIRRLPGIEFTREAMPLVLALALFVILLRHVRVNIVMDEVVAELKKVTWPSREEVVRSTVVVIVCIVVVSLILGAFDAVVGKVVGVLLKG